MNNIFPKTTSLVDGQQRSLSELLEQLKEKRHVFQGQAEMTPEKVKEILRSRARDIRAGGVEDDVGELLEILEFTLGKERYAFPLSWVSEVCRVSEITEIPGTPTYVKGVVNIRSRIYSVLDLSNLLALHAHPEAVSDSDDELLLILASREMEFGVCIDSLEGVNLLPLKSLQVKLSSLDGVAAEYFKGVTSDHLVVLDAEKLLNDKNIVME
ncbi:MAG: chemotaxis protein CheW [Pseudomonadota bacterium]|nr:chemotaxis protein CheW [Pseudomonadota bacterium]